MNGLLAGMSIYWIFRQPRSTFDPPLAAAHLINRESYFEKAIFNTK